MIFLALALLVALGAVIACLTPGSTAPIADAQGQPVPGSIAVLEKVMLGGVEQGLLIRGQNVANPVLLFLHGGPGTSELGMVRAYNIAPLEKHFTVVVWDQRGAGRQILSINLMEQAPEFKVPVYFLEGRHDYEALGPGGAVLPGPQSPPQNAGVVREFGALRQHRRSGCIQHILRQPTPARDVSAGLTAPISFPEPVSRDRRRRGQLVPEVALQAFPDLAGRQAARGRWSPGPSAPGRRRSAWRTRWPAGAWRQVRRSPVLNAPSG
jgi:hypothetical protein